jgi:hypothetical protein
LTTTGTTIRRANHGPARERLSWEAPYFLVQSSTTFYFASRQSLASDHGFQALQIFLDHLGTSEDSLQASTLSLANPPTNFQGSISFALAIVSTRYIFQLSAARNHFDGIFLADIHLPLFVRFCIANNIRICIYNDDILLVLPDDSDINID